MRKIAHIINPVKVDLLSDLYIAQPITFETMRIAQRFAKNTVKVTLYTTLYSEDSETTPEGFIVTPSLQRSILDFGNFRIQRKLPLLKDILDRLYQVSDAEYFIYTNVDIALMPYFYTTVNRIIDAGYDAFVINRRTILNQYKHIAEIPLMYAEIGEPHIGHDCFVFSKVAYSKYILGQVCIGINWIGRVLLWNLVVQATKFQEFKNTHLTFHIGNDKPWKNSDFSDYVEHNRREALTTLRTLNRHSHLIELLKTKHPEYLTGVDLHSL